MKNHNPIVFRLLTLQLLAVFVVGVVLTVGESLLPTFAASVQDTLQEKEFANVVKVHNKAWTELDKGNDKASESLFREAARQLNRYRSKYFKDARDRSSVDFLKTTYQLAYLSELGNKDKDARTLYEQCLVHPLINTGDATVDQIPISQLVIKRIAAIKQRFSTGSSPEGYPRISIRGGSKGQKDLPSRILSLTP